MSDKIVKINQDVVLESEDNLTADEILENAKGQLKEVLIIGFNHEGNEVVYSTPMTRAKAYFYCHEFAASLLERSDD